MRVPGIAIFLSPSKRPTPLALRAEVEHWHTLHDMVLIVSIDTVGIDEYDRFVFDLGIAPRRRNVVLGWRGVAGTAWPR